MTPKPDTLVNGGALQLALNILKRGTPVQREAAAELEKTVAPATPRAPDDYVAAWVLAHDLERGVSERHARAAFEDAQTWHLRA